MHNNSNRLPSQGHRYHPSQPPSDPDLGRYVADSVQDARRLLAVYPFASATPTTHVARHLSNLTISPTYMHPHYQHMDYDGEYGEYANELQYLTSGRPNPGDGGYWENTRNEAVRYLTDTPSYNYNYPQQDLSTMWQTGYQPSEFAQSILQHTLSSMPYVYQTPPPGIAHSSSSLANALQEQPRPPRKVYEPETSTQFFNEFVASKTKDLPSVTPSTQAPVSKPPIPTPPATNPPAPSDNILPRVQTPTLAPSVAEPQAVTPRKRKLSDTERFVPKPQSSHHASATHSVFPRKDLSSLPRIPKKSQVYVQVPPRPSTWKNQVPLSQPFAKRESSMNIHGRSDDSHTAAGSTPLIRNSNDTTGGDGRTSPIKRTGGRDDRAPFEKLESLIDEIFEAEDDLPQYPDPSDLRHDLFSLRLTANYARPCLSPIVVSKITTIVGKISRPTKRRPPTSRGQNGAPNSARKDDGRISDLEVPKILRLLKTLERSVQTGEDIDPFKLPPESQSSVKRSTAKRPGKGSKKGKMSEAGPSGDGPAVADPEPQDAQDPSVNLESLLKCLVTAKESILAAECCISILSSDRLPKQVYSEELISICFSVVKNQLSKIVYPFVEAATDLYGQVPPILRTMTQTNSTETQEHRGLIAEIFQILSSVIPRINNLIRAEFISLSDVIIIQAVYIAIGPFFVMEPTAPDSKGKKSSVVHNTLGNSAMKGLRLDTLTLIRSVFAFHEEQRSWIIEEILSSLSRLSDAKQKAGQFRLRDGRSIRTVSALLLQLVQTSAHDVPLRARKIMKMRLQAQAAQETTQNDSSERSNDDIEEMSLYANGLESAIKSAKTIVLFLTQRSGKTKVTKSSNEAEYRAIFDNFISDLLAVLFWPEWPAAGLLLGIICKVMVGSLDDVNTNQSDTGAARSMALDHLGVIASRLRSISLKFNPKSSTEDDRATALKSIEEVYSNLNIPELDARVSAHQDIFSFLCKHSAEDQSYDSARELTGAIWGQELASVLKQCQAVVTGPGNNKPSQGLVSFASKVKSALCNVWIESSADVFDPGSEQEAGRIDRLSEEVGSVQSLKSLFLPILNVVLVALDAPPVFMRTKALRALGQIVTSDPNILSMSNVRSAIEIHLLDHSTAVRDAAVDLIGKYMIDSPVVAREYYPRVAERVADTGFAVRKRVIKLLKSFYEASGDADHRIDICTKLTMRWFDEDPGIKELAAKTLEELWFQDPSVHGPKRERSKAEISSTVAVIMGVLAGFRERQSPLEDILHKMMVEKQEPDIALLRSRYVEICDMLIDGLVDASDVPGFTTTNSIRTIHLFTSAYPQLLTASKASTLLPYLKGAVSSIEKKSKDDKTTSTEDEQTITDYLLKIFRAAIPHMPKTATGFGQDLQLALQPMILKPSAGLNGLQETVACMCAVVQCLTRDFLRLVNLLKSCNGLLQKFVAKPENTHLSSADSRSLSMLILIVSLLCEHCDFDHLSEQREDVRSVLDAVSPGSITDHAHSMLVRLYDKYSDSTLKGRLLQCLGFLFRAQPSLMTVESSTRIMDKIFQSDSDETKGRMLKILHDFLVSEASKHAGMEKEKGLKVTNGADEKVNLAELVGNTEDFAESGVSSAVLQRYLDPILKAALSPVPQLQGGAIDVLTFTIKQGLTHPLQSFPVVVALETSPIPSISNRASSLHHILHNKHSSLLNSRYIVSARASFDYQKSLCGFDAVQGFRITQNTPTALLHGWYSLVREKRQGRLEFLRAMSKVFDMQEMTTQQDIYFARYMADNLACFEYKVQEDVLTVAKHLTSVLSTSGAQLIETVSPAHLLAQLHGDEGANQERAVVSEGMLPSMQSSVVIGVVMLLKAYLKSTYGISEEKCAKWVIGKKTAIGDKAATRRNTVGISWDRLPFATRPITTLGDIAEQRETFLKIWSEDGVNEDVEE